MICVSNNNFESILLDWAVEWLADRLVGAKVTIIDRAEVAEGDRSDALITIDTNSISTRLFVELRFGEVTPRTVTQFTSGQLLRMRSALYDIPMLVVAPFLSRQTQATLRSAGLGFLDHTGNAFLQLKSPAVYIETSGATSNPQRRAGSPRRTTLRGGNAGRLIRTLIDVAPPYSVTDLSRLTELDGGNVSRLLDALDQYGVLNRGERGRVTFTEIDSILSLWAERYSVLKSNKASLFVAPSSARGTYESLTDRTDVIVTGSFALPQTTRVTAPMQLIAYATQVDAVAESLGLVRTNEGANVVLLEPFDAVVAVNLRTSDGITHAAFSQVAIDCLTGSGRLPAEGAALVKWLVAHEEEWRIKSIDGAMQLRNPKLPS
jgi:hypothetical protein